MPNRMVLAVAAGLVLTFVTPYIAAPTPTPATSHPNCDYSFLVNQPIFRLVAPEESGTEVSLVTPLGVASESSNFGIIKQVELVPESGPIVSVPSRFKPLAQVGT
ncbi:MAG: hypothetical protein JOZ28_11325, partial [Candidatus Eremiobacteraeota bacterium]|nr:hypothetical protein [Candidatus Eremiobacteraeota bacterium]